MAEKKKVFVAMSGGVDSSVAAALLKESGEFDVVAAHMICWKDTIGYAKANECAAEKDAEDARRVADKLGIPFYAFDLTEEYRKKVFDYMIYEYKAGRTPNPDVMCNKEIKFGVFMERALSLGADYIATGHYIKKIKKGDSYKLISAKDNNKDQSYFLWTLTQKQLSRALFPIGDYVKDEVRNIARKFNLPTSEKKDSQGLCFVGKVNFASFLRSYIKPRVGKVLTTSGKEVGEHDGVEFYTIGQRHGIGIGGGTPYFVARRNKTTNTLIVAKDENDPKLYKKEINIANVNWISGKSPDLSRDYFVHIRYRQPLQKVKIMNYELGIKVIFDKPQRAVAEGQSLVLYDSELLNNIRGKEMLGGGIIA